MSRPDQYRCRFELYGRRGRAGRLSAPAQYRPPQQRSTVERARQPMTTAAQRNGFKIFSTCPPSNQSQPGVYLEQVRNIARWSEEAGCVGILVYTDNGLIDPWLVSQTIVESTTQLCPLVAVQP